MFFNCKMNLPYCATCSSPRLRQSPTRIIPLKTPLLVLYWILNLTLTLILTLLPLLPHFPVLVNGNFVVLPRWALWAKTNNSAKVDFQPTPNTQEAPATMVQNLTSRISKLEKLFADETSTYTSITAGTHSQYFFLYDKNRQLERGNSDVIIWNIPSVKFVFDFAKVARPSSDPLIEPATSFISLIFKTHPMDTISSSNSTHMVLDTLLASVLQFYSPSSLEATTTFSKGPSQSSSTLVFEISWTQWTPRWRQSDLIKTQPTRSPQCQQKLELQQP